MGISIDSAMANFMTSQATAARESGAASDLKNTVNNLGNNSTEEEIKEAVKDFESYFVEQMLKSIEKEFEDDSTFSQLTSFYMSSVNEKMADKLVDEVGGRLTQTLYEQMCRNYNIPMASDVEKTVAEASDEAGIEAAKETVEVDIKE